MLLLFLKRKNIKWNGQIFKNLGSRYLETSIFYKKTSNTRHFRITLKISIFIFLISLLITLVLPYMLLNKNCAVISLFLSLSLSRLHWHIYITILFSPHLPTQILNFLHERERVLKWWPYLYDVIDQSMKWCDVSVKTADIWSENLVSISSPSLLNMYWFTFLHTLLSVLFCSVLIC